MDEARTRTDLRINRLRAVPQASDGTVGMDTISMTCSGTDVRGPELEDEITRCVREARQLLESAVCECEGVEPPLLNCASEPILAGILARTFWLGYEIGKGE
jgi:hypothetical protein